MTNTVSNRQIFILLFLIIPSNVMSIAHNLARVSLRGGWVAIIIGTIVFSIVAYLICKLNFMHQGKTIVEYSQDVLGKPLAFILIVFFIIYFTVLFVFVANNYISFIHVEFFFKTSQYFLLVTGMIASGYIANKGITTVTRTVEIVIPIYLVFTFTLYFVALKQGWKYNVLPLFSMDEIKSYFLGVSEVIIPFIGAEMLLFIPFTQKNKKSPGLAVITLIIIGLYYILVCMATLSIVGINATQTNDFAGFEALKNVDIPVIERIDVIYETIGFATIFFKVSFYYLVITELFCRLLPNKKRWAIITVMGVILTAFTIMSMAFKIEDTLAVTLKILGVIVSILLPTALYIIAKVKNKNVKNTTENDVQETA